MNLLYDLLFPFWFLLPLLEIAVAIIAHHRYRNPAAWFLLAAGVVSGLQILLFSSILMVEFVFTYIAPLNFGLSVLHPLCFLIGLYLLISGFTEIKPVGKSGVK